ncbi:MULTISPECIES: hypothetical protein [unclassified Clostridioides]
MARGMAGTATIAVQSTDSNKLTSLEDIPDLSSIKSKVGILESSAVYHEDGYYESFNIIAANLPQLNKINKPLLVNGNNMADIQKF